MFRIACLVEDKNLPKVLHALNGLVLNMEPPVPVANATVKAGKVVAVSSASSKHELVANALARHPNQLITSAEIKEIIRQIGGEGTAYNYYVLLMIQQKLLKLKDRGTFQIIKQLTHKKEA